MLTQWKFCFFVSLALAVISRCEELELPKVGSWQRGADEKVLGKKVLKKIHGKMDADKDGNIALPEMMGFAKRIRSFVAEKEDIYEILSGMDTNKDSKLQLKEFVQDMEVGSPEAENAAQRFKAADRTGDGVLEADEVRFLFFPELHDEVLTLFATASMKQKDKDGDNKLSRIEFLGPEAGALEEFASKQHSDIFAHAAEDFRHADKDGDEHVNTQELKAWEGGFHREEALMTNFFKAADGDRDGLLSLHEFQAECKRGKHQEIQQQFSEWTSHSEL